MMSLLHKIFYSFSVYEKQGVGLAFIITKKRFFEKLTGERIKIFFRPDFGSSSGWHYLTLKNLEQAEELWKSNDAFSAMAVLRKHGGVNVECS